MLSKSQQKACKTHKQLSTTESVERLQFFFSTENSEHNLLTGKWLEARLQSLISGSFGPWLLQANTQINFSYFHKLRNENLDKFKLIIFNRKNAIYSHNYLLSN